MKTLHITIVVFLMVAVSSCGPKSIETETESLSVVSEIWIPFDGEDVIVFEYNNSEMVFTGAGRESYYEYIRYMTDQGGFLGGPKDYYANLERQQLIFNSVSTPYFIKYNLEHNKGELGDWDILRTSVGDGDYYQNEMKIVTWETESSDKGENFTFKREVILSGKNFENVYFKKQERRPFEIYYTKEQGIVAFKVSSTELWTLK